MRCTGIKIVHLGLELTFNTLHVIVISLGEDTNIDTEEFVTSLWTMLGSLVNGINDMGVVIAKAKA